MNRNGMANRECGSTRFSGSKKRLANTNKGCEKKIQLAKCIAEDAGQNENKK